MLTDKQIEREEAFCEDWYMTRKMGKTPTYADAIAWADKTMIEKACEWLIRGGYFVNSNETIEDFRKAMQK